MRRVAFILALLPDGDPKSARLEGEAYPDARGVILIHGWSPVEGPCMGGGMGESTCSDFPEIGNCSGKGVGYCVMTFRREDRSLTVVTTGGAPDRIDPEASLSTGRASPRHRATRTRTGAERTRPCGLRPTPNSSCKREGDEPPQVIGNLAAQRGISAPLCSSAVSARNPVAPAARPERCTGVPTPAEGRARALLTPALSSATHPSPALRDNPARLACG